MGKGTSQVFLERWDFFMINPYESTGVWDYPPWNQQLAPEHRPKPKGKGLSPKPSFFRGELAVSQEYVRHRELRMEDMCFRKGQLFGNSLLVASALPSKQTNMELQHEIFEDVFLVEGTYQKKARVFNGVTLSRAFYVQWLGTGFRDFLLSPLPGKMIQFDYCFFQMGWIHPSRFIFLKHILAQKIDSSPNRRQNIPAPSFRAAKWSRFRVSIYHPLGFKDGTPKGRCWSDSKFKPSTRKGEPWWAAARP